LPKGRKARQKLWNIISKSSCSAAKLWLNHAALSDLLTTKWISDARPTRDLYFR